MKKKGFTLVEIIAALIILAILLVVAIPGVNGIQKSIKNNMYCNKIGSIEAAAKLYGQDFVDEIEEKGYKNVSISVLLTNGLIEKEDEACIIGSGDKPCLADPRDNSSLDSKDVRIFKKGDKVTAYYVYDSGDDIDMCGGKTEEEMKGQSETIKLENGINLTKQGQDKVSVTFGEVFTRIEQLPEKHYTVTLINEVDGHENIISKESVNHDLAGYFLAPNGDSTKYYDSNGTSNKIFKDAHVNTLYAHWNYNHIELPDLKDENARTGYIVEGWYIKDTQIKVGSVGSNYIPTKDNIVLVAKWIPQRRTITLDEDIPNGEKTQIIAQYDSDLPKLDKIPSKTYTITFDPNGGSVSPTTSTSVYTFQGYYSGHNGTGTKYINADGTSARPWDSTTITTLYAHWTKTSATFPNATRTGYTFQGWYTAASGGTKVGNAGTTLVLNENKTVYAHWKANDYTVTLNNQGATGSGTTSITATFDSNLPNISVPSKSYTVYYNANGGSVSPTSATASYTFSGYFSGTGGSGIRYINSNGTSARTWNIASDTTLYAHWTGGNVSLPSASRTGYNFAGWYTAASGGTKVGNAGSSYAPSSNVTLYAHWTAKTFTVTLNNQGATSAGTTSITATYDSNLPNITKPTKSITVSYNANGGSVSPTSATSTYTFGGYYTSTGGGGTQYITASGTSARTWNLTSNTTLYAKWTGGCVTLPTPSRTGYTFAGWYTAASGGSKVGNAGSSYCPTSTVTIYAQWNANTYTVSFDRQGGSGGSGSATATYGSSMPGISLPSKSYTVSYDANGGSVSPTSSTASSTFGGYFTSTGGGGTQYYNSSGGSSRNYDQTSNITLYAQWTNTSVTLPTPSKDKYEFTGWYTASSGGTKIGNGGSSYTPTSNTTLYAQWKRKLRSLYISGTASAMCFLHANDKTIATPVQGGGAEFDVPEDGKLKMTIKTGYSCMGTITCSGGYTINGKSSRDYSRGGDMFTITASATAGDGSCTVKNYYAPENNDSDDD